MGMGTVSINSLIRKKDPKAAPKPPKKFLALGFVHKGSVFEPPKLKVDYHYYVFGTLEILIFMKSDENTAPAMLLEPPKKPV